MEYSNETLDTIHSRFSLRKFDDRPVGRDVKDAVLAAAFRAPTAGNMMLYSVIEIDDPALREALARSCDNQHFIAEAPWVTLFVADYQRWFDLFDAASVENPRRPGVGDLMLACSDALIAAQTAVIAAQSLELYSCYIGDILENAERVAELLHLPPYAFPICMLVFGFAPLDQHRRSIQRYDKRYLVHKDGYQRLPADELLGMLGARDPMEDVRRIHKRKIAAGFSLEMQRSVRRWLENWGIPGEQS